MRLYEFEGKELFQCMGIPVPKSMLAATIEETVDACEKMSYPSVVKAQVLRGGRGKAGLVKIISNKEEASAAARHMVQHLENNEKILIEEKATATAEAYIGITVDDINGCPIMVISKHGGVDVEQLATSGDCGTVKQLLDPEQKACRYTFMDMLKEIGFQGDTLVKLTDMTWKVYETFLKYDADTVEINPVLINEQTGCVLAGDAKIIVDDYSLYRQPQLEAMRCERDSIDSDVKSIFVDLGGNIGVISLGASMTMMVIDTIKYMGGEPANFADIAGGASKQNLKDMALQVFQRAVNDSAIRAVLVTFTLVAHPLRSAVEAVVEALQETQISVPVYASIRAASAALISMSMEDAVCLLKEAGINWCDNLDEAIAEVVEESKKG